MRQQLRLLIIVGLILSTLGVLMLSIAYVSSPYSDDDIRVSEALAHGTAPHLFGATRLSKFHTILDTALLGIGLACFYIVLVLIMKVLVYVRTIISTKVRAPPVLCRQIP